MSEDLEESLMTVAKGASIIFIGMIIGNIVGLFYNILLGRYLGVELYGQYNLALSVTLILETVALFGLIGSLPRFIPFHLEKGEKNIVKSTISFSLKFALITSLATGLIMFIISQWLATDIFHDNNLVVILRCLAIGLPIIALTDVLNSIIRGFKAVKYQLIIYDVGANIAKLIIFIIFFLIGYRLFGAIFAYLGSIILAFFVAIYIIRKKIFRDYSDYTYVSIKKNFLSFTWPLGMTAIMFLFIQKTDVILIGHYLSSEYVGIYSPAIILSSLLTIIGTALGYIFLPVISGLYGKEEKIILKSVFKSASKWLFLLMYPILLFILIFPKEIITLFYGADYSAGYLAFMILASVTSIGGLAGFTGGILVGSGRTRLILFCESIAGISNVIINIILIPRFGITGAAIGTGSSYLVRTILFFVFVYKITKMHPFTKDYIKIILIGFFIFGLIYFLKGYIINFLDLLISMIVLGLILLGAYIGFLLLTKSLDYNDKIILKVIINKLGLKSNIFRKFIRT